MAAPDTQQAVAPGPQDVAPERAPDNLLLNDARINTIGVDTVGDPQGTLSAVIQSVDGALEELVDRLMSDPFFAGQEQLRVLRVEGDLTQAQIVRQSVHLQDSDDVELRGAVPADFELVTGANAMINAARVDVVGRDSVVFAQETAYSDVLIHQASLVDEPEMRDAHGELVTEAVAFLIDETGAQGPYAADEMTSSHSTTVADPDDVIMSALT